MPEPELRCKRDCMPRSTVYILLNSKCEQEREKERQRERDTERKSGRQKERNRKRSEGERGRVTKTD